MSDYTFEDALDHDAARDSAHVSGDWYKLFVRPYGNATLLNKLAESSELRLGNCTTFDDRDDVVCNVKRL